MTLDRPRTAAGTEPLFEYEPRALTVVRSLEREIWALLKLLAIKDVCAELCSKRHPGSKLSELESIASRVAACLTQAEEYFCIAQQSSTRAAPLLHYYSMLNTAKAFIYVENAALLNDPRNLNHGLMDTNRVKDPRVFSLPKETVKVEEGIFNCLCTLLTGKPVSRGRSLHLHDLLTNCLWIASEVREVYDPKPSQIGLACSLASDPEKNEIWASVAISGHELDGAGMSLEEFKSSEQEFFSQYVQVQGPPEVYRFESNAHRVNTGQQREQTLRVLRRSLSTLNLYRPMQRQDRGGHVAFYRVPIGSAAILPQLSTVYAVAFYLSSLVRYQPHALEVLLDSGDAWVIESFLTQCPLEFSYTLLNHIWRREHIFTFAA